MKEFNGTFDFMVCTSDKSKAKGTTQTEDFLSFGVDSVAYIRPIKFMDRNLYAIHAADGVPLSVVESESLARDILLQNDLQNIRVH